MGEPVHDFKVYWERDFSDFGEFTRYKNKSISVADLKKYPDLYNEFLEIKPSSLRLKATVDFKTFSGRIGVARITMVPDLIPESGVWQDYSVPGSPSWVRCAILRMILIVVEE